MRLKKSYFTLVLGYCTIKRLATELVFSPSQVALKFLKYINARANIQGTIAKTPSLRSKPLQNAKRQGKPTAQWSNARDNDEFWGFDTFRIASLDTLFIMGMAKEYKETKDKIVENFKKIEVCAYCFTPQPQKGRLQNTDAHFLGEGLSSKGFSKQNEKCFESSSEYLRTISTPYT